MVISQAVRCIKLFDVIYMSLIIQHHKKDKGSWLRKGTFIALKLGACDQKRFEVV